MGVNTSRGQTFQWHLEHFTEEMEQYYNQIKDTDLDALLAPERSLFPNYGRRSRQRSNGAGEKSRHNVTISLDAEQYRAVTDGAAFCGIKPSLYCKRRILDETKLVINLPQYMPILYQMEEVCEELRALVYLVYRENGFDPVKGADEKRLEDAIAMMQKVQQSMGEEFLRLCRVIERARYEKTADVRASYVRVNAAERRYLCELLTEKETFLQRERLEKETDLMLASEEAEGFPVLQEDDPILMELATCGRLLKRMETKQAENESPDITQE